MQRLKSKLKAMLCMVLILCLFCSFDFKDKTGIVSQDLEKGLLKGLKPLATTFIEIEEKCEINSILYASMVALESGWGTSDLSESNNNITSAISLTDKTGYKRYATKSECLYDMADNLIENYFDENGMFYCKDTSLENVACYYYLGKPKEQMTNSEKQCLNYYVNTIEQIYAEIVWRIERIE